MTADPEPTTELVAETVVDPKFEEIDKRLVKFEEETPDIDFKWCDYEPFEFFFLLTGLFEAQRYGKAYINGHAKATPALEGPFPDHEWLETQLPLVSRLELALNEFAKIKGLKDLSEFTKEKEQVFMIAFHGIRYHDDPHQGKTRLYSFYLELVEEDGSRIALENWTI